MADVYRIEVPITVSDNTEAGTSSAKERLNGFDKARQKVQERLDKMSSKKYKVMLQAMDKASTVIKKVASSAKNLAGKAWKITLKAVDMATSPIRSILKLFKNPLFSIGAAIGITIGVKNTLDTYTAFEKSISNVRSLVNMTSKDVDGDMERISAKAREMGRTTSKSAKDAADAFGYMALAGWDTEKMLDSIKPVLDLSIAADMELGRASDLVTDSMSSLGDQAVDLEHYLNVVAKTAGTMNTDIDMLMEAFLECGGTVNGMKIPLEEASTLLGVLANRGLKGSEAGTALTSILVNLTATSGQAADAMKKLGVSAFDDTGSFKGYAAVLEEIYEKTKDLTDEEQNYYMSAIGMKMRKEDLQKLLSGISGEYEKALAAIEDSNGALKLMAETKNDNLIGDFKALTSALDEMKIALMGKLSPHFRSFIQWMTSKVPNLQKSVEKMADSISQKIENLRNRVKEFTSGQQWQNADIFEKIGIAWDKIIAQPFAEWWDSTGKEQLIQKAAGIGESLGSGITRGLLALLGFDAQSAVNDGLSVGSSFMDGFVKGFDGKKIAEAFINAFKGVVSDAGTLLPGGKEASATSGLSAALLGFGALKAGKSVFSGIKGGMSLFGNIKSLFSRKGMGSSGSLLGQSVATMAVKAAAVYISGPMVPGQGSGGRMLPGGNIPTLPGGAAAGAGGAINTVRLANGTLAASGGAVTTALANTGVFLGSGATTAAGAAVAGGASIGGAIGGVLGIGSGLIDIYHGTKKQGKEAKDDYVTGGTKIGMVGAGAGIGAAIGSVVPVVGTAVGALAGAGIGGIGALLSGSKVGKWISDITDADGAVGIFCTTVKEKMGEAWSSLKEGASNAGQWIGGKLGEAKNAVQEKWSAVSSWFNEKVWIPVKDLGISAFNIAVGFFEANKKILLKSWEAVSGWFLDAVWEPIKKGVQAAADWIEGHFQKAKNLLQSSWNTVSSWFTGQVWEPLKQGASAVWNWLSEQAGAAKDFLVEAWSVVCGWFSENVWEPIKTAASTAWNWLSEQAGIAKDFIIEAWGTASSWFAETVWEPLKSAAQGAGAWVSDKFTEAKTKLTEAWSTVSNWFSERVWEPIKSRASSAWSSIKEKWENAKSWVADLGQLGAGTTGLSTSSGQSSVLEHASGGIMTKPHMGIVAEAGPESIIPLSGGKRARGIDLWIQTGRMLGVMPYANGGIAGNTPAAHSPLTTGKIQKTEPQITIQVSVNQEVKIEGGEDSEKILQALRKSKKELAELVGDEVARKIAAVFSNTPRRAVM